MLVRTLNGPTDYIGTILLTCSVHYYLSSIALSDSKHCFQCAMLNYETYIKLCVYNTKANRVWDCVTGTALYFLVKIPLSNINKRKGAMVADNT